MKKINFYRLGLVLAFSLCLNIIPALAASFTDVSANHANYDAIEYVKAEGIVIGYTDGTYRPDSFINRAEFTKLIIASVYPETQDCAGTTPDFNFSDVAVGSWYADFVCMAYTNNIIAGYPDGTFKPEQNITFAEASKIIVKAFQYSTVTDNIWYRPFVNQLADKKAIPVTITAFDKNITRGEMAEMIYRLKNPTVIKPTATYGTIEANNVIPASATFLKISSPIDGALLNEEPFYIEGTTSSNCGKITVTADNLEYKIHDVYTLTNYSLGDTTFKYGVKHEWKNLDVGENTYSFKAYCDDADPTQTIKIYYSAGGGAEMGKPVIYLYPKSEQKVFVLPKPEGGITISEPALGAGWNVTAYPDGTIIDQSGKIWPYLFWEGYSNLNAGKEGFLVAKNDLGKFFDQKLSYLGLNEKEISDFKEYWLAKLNQDKYYFIYFISQSELDRHAPIIVEPKPDTVIRVFFDYKVSDAPFVFSEQVLTKGPARNGFTMTEWGGRLYK